MQEATRTEELNESVSVGYDRHAFLRADLSVAQLVFLIVKDWEKTKATLKLIIDELYLCKRARLKTTSQ